MTAPAPLRRTFVGPQGIRAGWRLLLFVVLAQGVIGLPLQWFVVRVLGLGDGGEWTAPGFMLAETVGGLGIVPTFAAAWLMSRMERRPFGAYGLPSRGAFGRQFWAGWGWGLGGVAALAALIAALGGLRVAGWALSGAALARAAVLWAIAMTLIGLAEEFAFRGYPQFTLASGIGFWRAAALLSLVFGGLHYFLKPMENLADFASVGLIGLFLCLTLRLSHRTGRDLRGMSNSIQLLCSTGAFSRFPDLTDYRSILTFGPNLEVDGFELMFYPDWTAEIEHIASELLKAGLKFPAIHAEKGIAPALVSSKPEEREQGWQWMQASCQLGNLLGANLLVFHLWGFPDYDEKIEQNLQQLEHC